MYRRIVFEKLSFGVLICASFILLANSILKINIFNKLHRYVAYLIYSIIFVSSFYNVSRRDYYLPFLGNSVYPCNSLRSVNPKNATLEIKVEHLSPKTNVIFWASEGKDKELVVNTPLEAYGYNSNTGVCVSDEKGGAVFKIREPVAYKIPTGYVLKKHVRYRECVGNGMLGPVVTVYV